MHMSQIQDIISKWVKIEHSSCDEKYPDILQFMENGVYNGSKGDNKSEFTIWDVGSMKYCQLTK